MNLLLHLLSAEKEKQQKKMPVKFLLDENYFGTMLVYLNKANGLVSGAAHSTADTVRPALQIIKTKARCEENFWRFHHGS